VRARLLVEGQVQGVGFRPFVYNLAREHGLAGWAANDSQGVVVELEGPAEAVAGFVSQLLPRKPPLAQVLRLTETEIEPLGQTSFAILPSRAESSLTALIPPDTAVCPDCLREMFDPRDRRFHYPFINCTNCGPRYTIIRAMPYDRPRTTMAAFEMCPDCRAEYEDPANRRFHAQPNACPVCGPRVWLVDSRGRPLAGEPLAEAGARLGAGAIVAVKGLGGFHLACDAADQAAVARLRALKRREERPLAVMVRDLAGAGRLVELDRVAAEVLESGVRPIVLAPQKAGHGLAPGVAGGGKYFGVMLAYTPLHHLLLAAGPEVLVMTSGNLADEPIVVDNRTALGRLAGVADCLLIHDRDIHARADDSVVLAASGRTRLVRRSRGCAPRPVSLDGPGLPLLALGGELKNTVCLTKGREAFLSPHIGDLKGLEALEYFEQTITHLSRLLQVEPAVLVADLHPDYLSSQYAEQRTDLPLIRVQHHAAHVLAGLAELGLPGPVLGLALDGTGLGPDGTIWGGELLLVGPQGFQRLGRLARFRLLGGDKAAKEPWRAAVGLLHLAFGADWPAHLPAGLAQAAEGNIELLKQMMALGLNSPWTSSAGRLFDGLAALAGLRLRASYDGQTAAELEAALDAEAEGAYPFDLRLEEDGLVLDPGPLVRAATAQAAGGEPAGAISARFHRGLSQALAQACYWASGLTGLKRVVLSGGCFMNAWLLNDLSGRLEEMDLEPLSQRETPANDGGLSLGQALAGRLALAAGDMELWTRPKALVGLGG